MLQGIADLEDQSQIGAKHISEAIGYRRLDRTQSNLYQGTYDQVILKV